MRVGVSEISAFLASEYRGEDLRDLRPTSISNLRPGALVFLNRDDAELRRRLNEIGEVACITVREIADHLACTVIVHDNPRLAFARALRAFFVEPPDGTISPAANIAPGAKIGPGCSIGPGSRIGPDVQVGANTQIGSNVVVAGLVLIGSGCIVKSNTTIGEPGFGFPVDENGNPVSFPHIGAVRIGNSVEIGANCTVVRAALDVTTIEDHVKTDDHVHIAHNCFIGARTRIAAGVILSGSVHVGCDVWISPNATVIDYARIGDGAFIGIGSVVTKPVQPGARVFGVPAKPIGRK